MDFQTRYVFDPKTDLLGKGGFSKVYKANDILLERTVALKFFTAKTAEKYQVLNEIKKVIRFEHPNLCKYYDVALLNYKNVLDETEQMEVGIMEYIDAGDFRSYIRKNPAYTDKLLIDVLKGLAYLHKRGMAHRDLKPQNILIKIVDDEPVAKITDFGISKMVDSEEGNSSALLGTIEYMAPEQFNPKKYGINGRISTNLDLWSYGLLVYEVICHQSLFGSRSSGISAEQVMSNILSDIPMERAEALPPRYREVVKRCLVKDATERVQNALELIPLFQQDNAAGVQVQAQTDSGKIMVPETQVLNLPVVENEDETKTVNLALQPDDETQTVNAAPADEQVETAVFDLPQEELPRVMITESEGEDNYEGATEVLQPVPNTSEVTQALPKPIVPAAEETQVLEMVPETATAEENGTQVINKNILIPAEKTVVEKPWSSKVGGNGQQKTAEKPVKKIVLLLATVAVIVIVVLVFALSKKSAPPAVVVPPAPVTTVAPKFPDPDMAPVARGSFMMGMEGDPTAPPHQITVDSFAIGRHEVTIEEFRKFVGETNYTTTAEKNNYSIAYINDKWDYKAKGINWRHDVYGVEIPSEVKTVPVVHVSSQDAEAYCNWLSLKTKRKYRLPTEAEWEFAARGGNSSGQFAFSGSNSLEEVGWYQKNSSLTVHPVAQKKANELGIFDMSGNASEWCADYYSKDFYKKGASVNPLNTESSGKRVNRGGATGAGDAYCKATKRFYFDDGSTGGTIGFRVCRANQ